MTALSRAMGIALCLLLTFNTAIAATPKGSVTISEELRQQLATFDISSSDPVDVIVKLAGEPAALVAPGARPERLNQIRAERGNVFSHLRRNGIQVSPKHEFDQVFVGFSLTIPANQLPVLATVPGVVGIYENVSIAREDVSDSAVMNVSPELATGVPAVQAPAAWSLGYRGQGMLVGILDDGVDWTHPDLGGCIGAGCKVVGGFDFIDLDTDPNNGWSVPTGSPAGTPPGRDYHGTHVAATAAGLKGVAPDANIFAVRVLGTNSTGQISNLSNVMAGIELAVRNNVDVINMSIGLTNAYGQSTNLWTEMSANAVKAGIVWVNSNGNDGPTTYRANMYGSSSYVIATGNADVRPVTSPRTTIVATGEQLVGGSYGIEFPASLLNTPLQIVDVGFGNSPAYYAGKDVAGKVVIASRGTGVATEDGTFVNKGVQAQAHGAVAIIISNNVAGDFFSTALATLPIPNFTLSMANGAKVRANPTVTISDFTAGPSMASGSSRGPTNDLKIKPDVSAPGTGIIAAVPFQASSTGYASLSGTSMAAPHVAGAAVLLRQANPSWTPQQVKDALMNTASNLDDLAGVSYRPIDQGAGLVNVSRALAPALRISQPSLSFGQLLGVNGYAATQTMSIESTGTYNVSSRFTQSPAGGTVTTTSTSIVPGASQFGVTVAVAPAAPAGEYQGYVTFTNAADATDTYQVPFLFVHNVPVSEITLSKAIARSIANVPDQITVSFKAGQPLAAWYLANSTNTTRFTVNQAAVGAGPVSYNWNVRSSTGGTLNGNWTLAVFYRLQGQTEFTMAPLFVRLFIDNAAPAIGLEEMLPSLTNERTVTVRGAVADSGMFTWGEVGGRVLVNGEPADLFPRAPTVVFRGTGWYSELAFDKTVTLAEGQNTIVIYAEDAAGNRSTSTFNLSTTLDSIAPVSTSVTNPGPNAAGWNNTNASLDINATDGGSGVKEIVYSVNGAAAVTVASATASIGFGEGQYAVSYFASDIAGNVEASQTANVWIDVTAPAIAFSGNGSYTVDQQIVVNCVATDNLSGVAATNCSSPLLSKFGWELALGTTTLTATASDVAGNNASSTTTVMVSVTFDSLVTLTARFANGELGNSLLAKLAAAKESSARGNFVAMNAQLQAYQSEVQAQSGKALAADQASVLAKLSESLKK